MRFFICFLFLALGFAPPTLASSQGGFPNSPAFEGGSWWSEFTGAIDLTGFWEMRLAVRLQDDQFQKPLTLAETRFQIDAERDFDVVTLNLTADVFFDVVSDQYEFGLNGDEDIIDLRQATAEFSPFDFMDVKLGRQVLTWGTGDLLFINDLFPKDWRSFLLGRDDEYLKAPTDAVKVSFYFSRLNLDAVYMPEFVPDRYINGSRVSYFDPAVGALVGRPDVLKAVTPGGWFEKDELSLRLYQTFGPTEVAAYYYDGFWKSPAGTDTVLGQAVFPELKVYGGSMRSALFGGIVNAEFGYYNSQDGAGETPFIRNDEIRLLAGYERDLGNELTLGLQYSLEHKLHMKESLPAREARHVVTQRVTKQFWQQTLSFSLFNFYSPSEHDGHLRLKVAYKITDAVKLEGGFNVFYGRTSKTFFGQFQKTSNVSAAVRVSF